MTDVYRRPCSHCVKCL